MNSVNKNVILELRNENSTWAFRKFFERGYIFFGRKIAPLKCYTILRYSLLHDIIGINFDATFLSALLFPFSTQDHQEQQYTNEVSGRCQNK